MRAKVLISRIESLEPRAQAPSVGRSASRLIDGHRMKQHVSVDAASAEGVLARLESRGNLTVAVQRTREHVFGRLVRPKLPILPCLFEHTRAIRPDGIETREMGSLTPASQAACDTSRMSVRP
jgi:hypothetical protein